MTSHDWKTISVKPLSGHIGAEIGGVDLGQDVPDDQFAEIKQAYDEFGVIFFRDQDMSPEAHIRFAERWAPINVNRFFQPVAEYPKIAMVLKEPGQKKNIGGQWHTDHSYDQVPAMGSILHALETPPVGGDTMFASMAAAWEGLSDGLKEALDSLQAVHSSRHVFGVESQRGKDGEEYTGRLGNAEAATQDAVHPVVVRHPRTGRKTLYVNPNFTTHFVGWTEEESAPLLEFLYTEAARPEYACRFVWQPGSIAFWDNVATWHRAINDYHGHRRLMHRITVEGVPLSA